jgi:hypothetical protein
MVALLSSLGKNIKEAKAYVEFVHLMVDRRRV